MVLPLPLKAIEHYMLADDLASYPRCFFIEVRLGGSLEETRLREAIDVASRRHPLLRALVEYDEDRPHRWIACDEPDYPIEWCAETEGRACDDERPVPPIDLRREPGLRFRVRREAEGDVLGIEFHHACTDGIGAVQFVDDLLALYAAPADSGAAPLPRLDSSRLASRDSFGLIGWRRPLRWLYGSLGWLAAIEFLIHRPAALGDSLAAMPTQPGRVSGFRSRSLTARQTSALIRAAKNDSATVNDLLMRDMFVTLQEFTERHWPERAKNLMRIMVPVNLRTRGDKCLPAANVVAMINVDRRPYRWTNRRRMLRVLHWELTAVKRLRLGVIFVQILHTLQTLFGSLQRFLAVDRCQATCVVSNLGIVLPTVEMGMIRAIAFYPPIRPLTAAAFGVVTHDGTMTVSLHYDGAVLSAEQGTELIDRFVQRLQAYGVPDGDLSNQPVVAEEEAAVAGHEASLPAHS